MKIFEEKLKAENIPLKGAIHVGYIEESQINSYENLGFEHLLVIVPDAARLSRISARNSPLKIIVIDATISNFNGRTNYHLINDANFNSILEPTAEAQTNLNLKVLNTTTVTVTTLNQLIESKQLNLNTFSYLHLANRGAQFLSLQGATQLLKSSALHAVHCDLYHQNLYQHSGNIFEVENLMYSFGFNRCTSFNDDTQYSPTLYVRRPVIAMSYLGNMGRFGNQLFQYTYLSLTALRQNAIPQCSPWNGMFLFGLSDPVVLIKPPLALEEHCGLKVSDAAVSRLITEPSKFISLSDETICNLDLVGFFQFHTAVYRPFLNEIKKILRLTPTSLNFSPRL